MIQSQIADSYSSDIVTYVGLKEKKPKVKDIFQAIPSELNAKNKRFVSSHVLDANYVKSKSMEDDFLWLTNAGVAIPAYNVTEPVLPIEIKSGKPDQMLVYNHTA